MISPQNLTIAATAVGILGRKSDLFRKTVLWSIGLLLVDVRAGLPAVQRSGLDASVIPGVPI